MQLKTLMPDIYTLIPSDYASIRCREYERLLSLYMSCLLYTSDAADD